MAKVETSKLKRWREAQPDESVLGALLDDLIERRQSDIQAHSDASLLAFCRVDTSYAGDIQHVTLIHTPTGLTVAGENQAEALTALRKALVTTFGNRPDFDPAWKPSC